MILYFLLLSLKSQCFFLPPPFLFLWWLSCFLLYWEYRASQLCKPITFFHCQPVRLYHFPRNPPLSLLQISFPLSIGWFLSETRTLIHWQWKYKIVSIWKTIWQFIINFSITSLQLNNSISYFCYIREMKRYIHKKTRTRMFKVPNWKHFNCLSIQE